MSSREGGRGRRGFVRGWRLFSRLYRDDEVRVSEVPGGLCSFGPGLCSTYTGLTDGGSFFRLSAEEGTGCNFTMQRASSYLAHVNESTKALVSLLSCTRYYRAYNIGDDEGRSKAAKVYTNLTHLLVGQCDRQSVFHRGR